MLRKDLYDKGDKMSEAIYQLYNEGILTSNQRYHCDKKLQKWTIQKSIKWYKKIRV